ncbi:S-Ena type endospore appendage [Paenibacillus silvisoli]|uniref:S-Ena type endospore appendage n=1 Tax=Paenibacillus silvisoli TaxID=3110539 RepID=UPI002804B616|nr:S-Ena type endospore appendage [Paenibacillus silvisoli]
MSKCHIRPKRKRCARKKKKPNPLTKLVTLSRCVPIKQACDNKTPHPYFRFFPGPHISAPSGTITIVNSSKSCTMDISIVASNDRHVTIDVAPGSSYTAMISNLISIQIVCSGQGQSETSCTGSLALDLQYVYICC